MTLAVLRALAVVLVVLLDVAAVQPIARRLRRRRDTRRLGFLPSVIVSTAEATRAERRSQFGCRLVSWRG